MYQSTNDKFFSKVAGAILFLLVICICFIISYTTGHHQASEKYKQEAIDKGFAYYEIIDNKGNIEFKWKVLPTQADVE